MRAYHPVLMTLYPAIRSVFVPARSSPRPFDPMASASFQPVAASAASAPPRPAPRHPFAAAAAARRSSLSLRPAAHRPVIPLRSSAVAANTLRATHRRAVSARWVLPTGLAPICWAHPSCWRARVAPPPPADSRRRIACLAGRGDARKGSARRPRWLRRPGAAVTREVASLASPRVGGAGRGSRLARSRTRRDYRFAAG
jgi:hypothetical protein